MKRRSKRHYPAVLVRSAHWAQPVGELHGVAAMENLHRITPTLYRGSQPMRQDLAMIRALGIRTVVSLRSFNSDARIFGLHDGIALERVRIDTWAIKDDEVFRALKAILDAERRGPVLLHCWHGADRTGVVAAVYRMAVLGWSRDEARHEMFRGGYGYHAVWRNIPSYLARVDIAAMRLKLGLGPLTT